MPKILLLCLCLALCACAAHVTPPSIVSQKSLTVERLFASPDLDGPAPANLKISTDGKRIGFLRGSAENRLRYDLWEFNIASGQSRRLVSATDIVAGNETLSDAERARRERQRISALSGIVDYFFSPDGASVLFPLSGDLYLYHLGSGETRQLTDTPAAEIDPKFSPNGRYVSFVRNRELQIIDLKTSLTSQLTNDASETVANGLADFIAQEEMGRNTGYWWAPDESAIAFLQTDDAGVELTERYEVYADNIKIIEQRYPATGTTNITNRLGVFRLSDSTLRWIDLGGNNDIYVPRVDWFPESNALAVQRQSRSQQQLELLRVQLDGATVQILLTETSETWVNIFDELTFLPKRGEFIWSSDRDGFKHLYLYDYSGNLQRQLTSGGWEVTGNRSNRALQHVDVENNQIYFMATAESPTERHLYVAAFDDESDSPPQRLTDTAGWHDVSISDGGEFLVDQFSAGDIPPQVKVYSLAMEELGAIEANSLDDSHPYAEFRSDHASMTFGILPAEDGQSLHYYIRVPKAASATKPHPVIVMVYGGPHGQRVRNAWGNLIEQVMVERGYVVFSLDNRGTSFRGTAFDSPIYRRLGQDEVLDQQVGVEFLRSLEFVDAQRIGIFGWSYGGYMALQCLMQTPQLYAAGVAGAPVTDWSLYDTHYTERYLGTPANNPAGYEAGSVFPYVDALAAPLLLMHGMADDNVLFSNTTRLMQALQKSNKRFELMTYPGSKHSLIRGHQEGVHAYETILDFFDRHLARP